MRNSDIAKKIALVVIANSSNFTPEKEETKRFVEILEVLANLELPQPTFINDVLTTHYNTTGELENFRKRKTNTYFLPQDNVNPEIKNLFLQYKSEIETEMLSLKQRLKQLGLIMPNRIKIKNKDLPKSKFYDITQKGLVLEINFDLRMDKFPSPEQFKKIFWELVTPKYMQIIKTFYEFVTDKTDQLNLYDPEQIKKYESNLNNEFIKNLEIGENDVVLDLGTGEGVVAAIAKQYSNNTVIGIDVSKKALLQAKENMEQSIDFFQSDAVNIPFKDETFNVVISSFMLQSFPNQIKRIILKEILRALKPNGIIGLCVYPPHEGDTTTNWYKDEWFEELEAIGFKVDFIKCPDDDDAIIIKARKPISDLDTLNIKSKLITRSS